MSIVCLGALFGGPAEADVPTADLGVADGLPDAFVTDVIAGSVTPLVVGREVALRCSTAPGSSPSHPRRCGRAAGNVPSGERVSDIAEGDDGTLWLATDVGVFQWTPDDSCWRMLPEILGPVAVAQLDGGLVAIGEAGPVSLVDGGWDTHPLAGTGGGPYADAVSGPDGMVVAWSFDELVVVDGGVVVDRLAGEGEIVDVAADDDRVLIATAGVFSTAGDGAIRPVTVGPVDGNVTAVARADGTSYVGAAGGVWRSTGDAAWERDVDLATSIPYAITVDRDGTIWIGTDDGVVRSPVSSWRRFEELDGEHVIEIEPDRIVVARRRAFVHDGTGWSASDEWEVEAIDAVVRDDEVFVGTEQGLFRFADDQLTPDGRRGTEGPVIAVEVDADNRLWIATPSGVRAETSDGFVASPASIERVVSMWTDPSGSVWIGGANLGVEKVTSDTATPVFGFDTPAALVEMGAVIGDRIVMATPGGLLTSTPDGTDLHELVGGAGLETARVAGFAATPDQNRVWVASDRGLYLTDLTTGRANRFGPADGIPNQDVTTVATTEDGDVWIGTATGLAVHRDHGVAPFATLDSITVDGVECPDCLDKQLPHRSERAVVSGRATDLADWDDLAVSIEVTAAGRPIEVDGAGGFRLDDDTRYDIIVVAEDRHFNRTASEPFPLEVAGVTIGDYVLSFLALWRLWVPSILAAVGLFAVSAKACTAPGRCARSRCA